MPLDTVDHRSLLADRWRRREPLPHSLASDRESQRTRGDIILLFEIKGAKTFPSPCKSPCFSPPPGGVSGRETQGARSKEGGLEKNEERERRGKSFPFKVARSLLCASSSSVRPEGGEEKNLTPSSPSSHEAGDNGQRRRTYKEEERDPSSSTLSF